MMPMRLRHGHALSASQVIERVAYGALDWPSKTVRLQRDSLNDYCQRVTAAQPSLAELYHEHSKLFPSMRQELLAARSDPASLRREFLRRRGVAVSRHWRVQQDKEMGGLLTATANGCGAELFYAIELRILSGDSILLHEPISDLTYLMKTLTSGEVHTVRQAIDSGLDGARTAPASAILFVMGSFARNDLLYGVRGYRRTLVEAGRVCQEVVRSAGRCGLHARVRTEFFDRTVDGILEADGTEEGALVAIELERSHVG